MIADLGLARRLERAADAGKNKNKNKNQLQDSDEYERKGNGVTAWAGTAACDPVLPELLRLCVRARAPTRTGQGHVG